MVDGMLKAARMVRADATQAARFGAKEGASYLEASANNIEEMARTETTDVITVAVCPHCGRAR